MTQHPLITVVVVNFNAGPLVVKAVEAALASDVPVEIIVCDNGSRDGSLAQLQERFGREPGVRLLENGRNLGFARANNLAFAQALGHFILLLNPDCIVKRDSLGQMLAVLDQYPDAGMAGPLVQNPDGTEQAGARRRIPLPWRAFVRAFGLSRLLGKQFPAFNDFTLQDKSLPEHPIGVEAISGAFMLIRRSALEAVGPLDEGYFLHVEDLDWCIRFRQAGWRVLFVPHVRVTHHKGACSKDRPIRVLWQMHKGMVRFYRKFFRQQYPGVLMWLVVAGVWLRFAVLTLYHLARNGYRAVRAG